MVSEQGFQPATEEVPVQILGMAGAAEMQFKHLWIMGLHEEVWPQPAQVNPFIPAKMQQEYRMPGASAEVTLEHARRVTQSLVRSAEQVVVSVPLNDKERELRPSPFSKL